MIYILINLVPILVATLIGLMLGTAYHVAFGRGRVAVSAIIVAALGLFWFASILAGALILAPPKAAPWIMAVGSAVVIWVGFVLPVVAVTQRYHGAAPRRIVGDSVFWLVTMVAQAVAMKVIGLVPPPV
ncbi:hypothetical protein E2E30_03330 [Sphingomonas sp. AAP5]|jgi:hypothetical protein|uniref:hypothetical protein n=1 Tax=Sphingomonas sp. AAP5 TaxID=1523415 RepID=UPI0010575524|nr:hypothetical protein [Sphingomonas sp. AAP5]QBM74898.1 hypothetical protein E2E30_03330 [Sphingomonas sp. AAP5]